jgi:hypothetical protein
LESVIKTQEFGKKNKIGKNGYVITTFSALADAVLWSCLFSLDSKIESWKCLFLQVTPIWKEETLS